MESASLNWLATDVNRKRMIHCVFMTHMIRIWGGRKLSCFAVQCFSINFTQSHWSDNYQSQVFQGNLRAPDSITHIPNSYQKMYQRCWSRYMMRFWKVIDLKFQLFTAGCKQGIDFMHQIFHLCHLTHR